MAVLGSIIQPSMLAMLDAGHDRSLGRAVAREFVGDHHARCYALLLEQLPQQALGSLCIPAALDQDIEHGSVLVDGAPQPMLLASDADHNLIKMPFVSGCGQTPADPIGKALAELERPLPHRLVADQDTAGGQHLLHHAQAQWKSDIEPNRVGDDLGWKAMTFVANELDEASQSTRLALAPELTGQHPGCPFVD